MAGDLNRTQGRLIEAVLAESMRVRRGTADQVAGAKDDMQKALVAQNVLRTCMEAATTDAMPFGPMYPIELAVRLASYAVSILPADQHDAGIRAVLEALPDAHRRRMAQGVCIKAEWGMSR